VTGSLGVPARTPATRWRFGGPGLVMLYLLALAPLALLLSAVDRNAVDVPVWD